MSYTLIFVRSTSCACTCWQFTGTDDQKPPAQSADWIALVAD